MSTDAAWRVKGINGGKGHGQPTKENLDWYMLALLASQLPGECNDHLGTKCYPISAELWTNSKDPSARRKLVEWELDPDSEIGRLLVHLNAPFSAVPQAELDRMIESVKGLTHDYIDKIPSYGVKR